MDDEYDEDAGRDDPGANDQYDQWFAAVCRTRLAPGLRAAFLAGWAARTRLAARTQPGSETWTCTSLGTGHAHYRDGQRLEHDHPGGDVPHGYYGHPEDPPAPPPGPGSPEYTGGGDVTER